MATIHKEYKEKVTLRFLEAMRRVLMSRVNGCKTVSQFCTYIGEHQQNISKMENGERYPTIDQIGRLCDVFSFSPSWLLLGKGNMTESADLNAAIGTLNKRLEVLEFEIDKIKKAKKLS